MLVVILLITHPDEENLDPTKLALVATSTIMSSLHAVLIVSVLAKLCGLWREVNGYRAVKIKAEINVLKSAMIGYRRQESLDSSRISPGTSGTTANSSLDNNANYGQTDKLEKMLAPYANENESNRLSIPSTLSSPNSVVVPVDIHEEPREESTRLDARRDPEVVDVSDVSN